MSNINLLPILQVLAGVQPDEDFVLTIAFWLSDNVTPVALTGITFTASIQDVIEEGVAATINGVISGTSSNILTLQVLAAAKANWQIGTYALTMTASDGTYARDVFAFSTLTVGAPALDSASQLIVPGLSPLSYGEFLSSALTSALIAAEPANMAAALAALAPSQLVALAQACLPSLPVQTGASAPVPAGEAFINSFGYFAVAQ